jgi:acyl-CoA synthetase (AMP-forming)/AMP-acid ligase II
MANESQVQNAALRQGFSGEGFHPAAHAQHDPTRPAIIDAESGRVTTYAELDAVSNQIAHLVRSYGLQIGDTVAICLDNHPMYLALAWGVERAGLIYVPVSYRLTVPEIAYILEDSGAKLLFGFEGLATVLNQLLDATPHVKQLRFETAGAGSLEPQLFDVRSGVKQLVQNGREALKSKQKFRTTIFEDVGDFRNR